MLDLEEINTYNAIQIEKTFIRNKRFQFFLEKKTTKQAVFKCSFQSRLLPILKKMHPCPQVLNLALTKLRLVVIYDYNMRFPAFVSGISIYELCERHFSSTAQLTQGPFLDDVITKKWNILTFEVNILKYNPNIRNIKHFTNFYSFCRYQPK